MKAEEEKKDNACCSTCGKGICRSKYKLKRNKDFYCSPECQKKSFMTKEEIRLNHNKSCRKYDAANKEKINKHYLENRPRLLEYKKEWAKQNESRCRKVAKKYYNAHKDTISAKGKEYYLKNKDVIAVKQKEYNTKNKATINEHHRKYYQENHEKLSVANREWALNNRDSTIESSRKHRRVHGEEIRADWQQIRDELGDHYIKRLICDKTKISTQMIPQELIELKRAQMILYRLIKERTQK